MDPETIKQLETRKQLEINIKTHQIPAIKDRWKTTDQSDDTIIKNIISDNINNKIKIRGYILSVNSGHRNFLEAKKSNKPKVTILDLGNLDSQQDTIKAIRDFLDKVDGGNRKSKKIRKSRSKKNRRKSNSRRR